LGKPWSRSKGPLDVHALIEQGLASSVLMNLLARFHRLPRSKLLKAVGMSERTVQRHKKPSSRPLSPDQSGRVWKLARIYAKATEVFGSQERAEQWLDEPAIGLNRKHPIELLTTIAGAELVEKFLGRLEHGVYT
jgi:putative toxin-antitoxin system antitoxin component (TIGR02293 family)